MKYRFVLMLVPVLAAHAVPALAGAREDMQAAFFRCGAITDDRTYLNCIYGAAQPLRAELGLPPAPASQTELVPPAGAGPAIPLYTPSQSAMAPPPVPRDMVPKNGSGFNKLAFGDNVDRGMVAAQMTSYAFDNRHMFTVTLSNKEVWRQVTNDAQIAHWTAPAAGYKVTLLNPTNGNAQLQVEGEADIYQVHRLR